MSDQQRLHMALNAAHMSIWDSKIVNGSVLEGAVIWSGSGAALLGLEAQALVHSFQDFMRYVHPDDQAHVVQVLQDAVARRCHYALEYCVVWPDGTLHWLSAQGQVLCLADGTPSHTLGIIWDITARRLHEIDIAERKELAEITLSSIGDAVITTDAQGVTQYMNRVAEQLTGWSSEQACGQDIRRTLALVDEITGEAMENVAILCLRQRQSVGVSTRTLLLTHDGRRVAVEDSAAPIRSPNGDIKGAVIVFHDVSHERKLKQELSWQATHDALTGLINRREFEVQVADALHGAKMDFHVHALLYLDLDQFKIVNDTCGHAAGDVLLQMLTSALQAQMRDSDVLARLGGDELGVLLSHCPLRRGIAIAEQLRKSVKEFRFVWEGRSFELGVSIGLVEICQHSKSLTDLMVAADQACYLAKEQGRNRVRVYHESDLMLAQRHGEMLWVARLNEAFEQRLFRLYAMPIVHLREPAESHDEVLLRLTGRHGDIIAPGAFIPAAERYDMMVSIDRWVIKSVCRYVAQARASALAAGEGAGANAPVPILYSINLSGVSLGDAGLHRFIIAQFERYAIAPEKICFEITETAVIADLSNAQIFMGKLKAIGCRFSLDDFGSGLSSFAYLKSLPVDYLKIDGIFVRDIASNEINRAMVKAINEVGHVMGLRTVAEYVEDDAVLAIVRDLGLDYAQGHAVGLARPLAMAAA